MVKLWKKKNEGLEVISPGHDRKLDKIQLDVSAERSKEGPLSGIKHVIAVASGKGGVGKSTTAVNLAFALNDLGAKVGIMDGDIYGPSVPHLLGSESQPVKTQDGKIKAPEKHGVKFISMGVFREGTPTIWRGPMASRAISQFLGDVDWGELDYLIVDLPPGTGDIQITISQSARLSGAIIVMTPQGLAKDVAEKGLKMFQQVRVPIIGIVENMSFFVAPDTQKQYRVFGEGSAEKLSQELGFPILAKFPLAPEICDDGEAGNPVVLGRDDSYLAEGYRALAKEMVFQLDEIQKGQRQEKLSIVGVEPNGPQKSIKFTWSDGKQSLISFHELRYLSPSAECVDEVTGERKIKREDVSPDVAPGKIHTVGNYALQIHWTDGHSSGIYSFDYLRRILSGDKAPPLEKR